jgi:hypothetical protein
MCETMESALPPTTEEGTKEGSETGKEVMEGIKIKKVHRRTKPGEPVLEYFPVSVPVVLTAQSRFFPVRGPNWSLLSFKIH